MVQIYSDAVPTVTHTAGVMSGWVMETFLSVLKFPEWKLSSELITSGCEDEPWGRMEAGGGQLMDTGASWARRSGWQWAASSRKSAQGLLGRILQMCLFFNNVWYLCLWLKDNNDIKLKLFWLRLLLFQLTVIFQQQKSVTRQVSVLQDQRAQPDTDRI